MSGRDPRVDPNAPSAPRKLWKKWPNLPWVCQTCCRGDCKTGDGSCPSDPKPEPLPLPTGLRTHRKPLSDRGRPGELQWIAGTTWR